MLLLHESQDIRAWKPWFHGANPLVSPFNLTAFSACRRIYTIFFLFSFPIKPCSVFWFGEKSRQDFPLILTFVKLCEWFMFNSSWTIFFSFPCRNEKNHYLCRGIYEKQRNPVYNYMIIWPLFGWISSLIPTDTDGLTTITTKLIILLKYCIVKIVIIVFLANDN